MIRVLHVIGAMDRGGAETMIMNLYRTIDRTQIQFDFLVHEKRVCDYDQEIQDLGGKIFRGLPRYSLINHLQYRQAVRKFFLEHDEHPIVHGHIASSAAIYLNEAKRAGRVTVAHSHSQHYPLSIPELGFRILTYPTRFVADQFLGCSVPAGRDRYGEHIIEGDAFHLLKNAIDVDLYAADHSEHLRAKEALGYSGIPLVGHVGRFDPVKNHEFLIKVFTEVNRRIPATKLILVGRGPIEAKVRKQVEDAGLNDSVVFYGVTDQVSEVLKALDVFVFPSFSEGLSVAAVEAQTSGVRSVFSTGVPELAIIAPDSVDHLPLDAGVSIWADAVETALLSETERSAGAQAARDNGFDIADSAKWLTDYYLELIK